MKRRRTDDHDATPKSTPKKARSSPPSESEDEIQEAVTPSRRSQAKRSLAKDMHMRSNGIANGTEPVASTPKSAKKVLFATPTKASELKRLNGTPTIERNADRSARRKSARRLIERELNPEDSEKEISDEEDQLAAEILGEEEDDEDADPDGSPAPETPSKTGRGRARSQRKRKERSPTPPLNLPPHEQYFWQNRPGANKTSSNTLVGQKILDHEEYFHALKDYQDHHEPEKEFLLELHARAFDQWIFELAEGFNVCLYGYGSKTTLVDNFASHLYDHLAATSKAKTSPKILIVNGSNPTLSLREILSSIATTFLPKSAIQKLPTQPQALLSHILTTLSINPPSKPKHILLNTIDSPSLRRAPAPALLAALAASPHISLLATADTPNFPILWDTSLRAQYRFLFHDATTFAPYTSEISVVDDVNILLGRTGRKVQGKDGVSWVLRSLPQNARALFLILISEQLAVMFENGDDGDEEMEAVGQAITPQKRERKEVRRADEGVEYRVLYHKAVEAFICSSEVAFRTLLKEFHDHQMVESRKDGVGTERLVVPFRREELEGLVEELAAEE
ncbi:ORC2-domain-containing protein [Pseudovirgaria hyperparasitica]|uniref:Origin recognition complex subunit 2 n=1 Tax=Pseudovirgaria hyperparasitica TaxID=470096 RepID=A0A6A6W1Q8_9PEZI|nr:ORC2-domain-containing protein [Pseudovirgaria hyperparasitica]KAF2755934.1 ORC2-domain-containing protein [Pseudovirgaria hyperparasitica]